MAGSEPFVVHPTPGTVTETVLAVSGFPTAIAARTGLR